MSAITASTPVVRTRRRVLSPTVAFAGTAIAFASLYLAAGAPSPLFALLEEQWGFPPALLTIAFAAYAIGLLAALLVVGGLSDHLGRRPVLIASLAVELVAMVMFIVAPNIGWLIAARVVQGIATGAATSAFTASVIELAPPRFARVGQIIGATAAAGGLGLGALLGGVAVQFSARPAIIVFSALAVIMAFGIVIAAGSTETVSRRAGALRSLVPKVTVPPAARRDFIAAVPGLVGAWMLAALFLGLVPSMIRVVFHIDSGLLNGTTAFIEPGAAAVAGFVLGSVGARRVSIIGNAAVLVGAATIVVGIATGILPLVMIGGLIGGVGFGSVFSGTLRLVGPLAGAHERAALFAAVFAVAYLAFGVPAIVVGQLVAPFGLLATAIGFAIVIGVASALGLATQLRAATLKR
ncbi:MFS transporter [soil metagenome]